MNDSRAIAAVTATFGQAIAQALADVADLSAAPELRLGRPVADPGFVGAALFLYRVAPNGARRNDDLATRSQVGPLTKRPRIAVDLDYLVSFHGQEARLEPQRLIGAVLTALHADPFLTAERVRAALQGAGADDPLAGAAYDEAAAPVRLTLATLDTETLHRIWGLFPQAAYAPSLVYTASPVVMEAQVRHRTAPPAREIVVEASPRRRAAP